MRLLAGTFVNDIYQYIALNRLENVVPPVEVSIFLRSRSAALNWDHIGVDKPKLGHIMSLPHFSFGQLCM